MLTAEKVSISSTIPKEIKETIDVFTNDFIEKFNLNDEVNSLSGGRKHLLSILCALKSYPEVLVLDESLSNLDSNTKEAVFKLLDDIKGHITCVVVEHNAGYDINHKNIVLNKFLS